MVSCYVLVGWHYLPELSAWLHAHSLADHLGFPWIFSVHRTHSSKAWTHFVLVVVRDISLRTHSCWVTWRPERHLLSHVVRHLVLWMEITVRVTILWGWPSPRPEAGAVLHAVSPLWRKAIWIRPLMTDCRLGKQLWIFHHSRCVMGWRPITPMASHPIHSTIHICTWKRSVLLLLVLLLDKYAVVIL